MSLLGALVGVTFGCLLIGKLGLAIVGALLCGAFYALLTA